MKCKKIKWTPSRKAFALTPRGIKLLNVHEIIKQKLSPNGDKFKKCSEIKTYLIEYEFCEFFQS